MLPYINVAFLEPHMLNLFLKYMYILITFYVNLSRNRKKIKNYQRILYINADHIMDRKNGLLKKSSIKIDKKSGMLQIMFDIYL